jgi:class 3 adenylate cyclase
MSDRQSTSCCSESLDSERHRSRIVQNIQRFACHVSKSVLTYVREEVIWHHHSVSSHDEINKDITLYPPTHGDTGYDGDDNFGSVDTAAFDDTSACSDISESTHGNDTKVTEVCDAQERKRRICASLTLKLEKSSNERLALTSLKTNLVNSTIDPTTPQQSKSFPYTCRYDAALLFVDISGFTKLSTLLNPEDLSRIINDYFETIVDEVSKHGGDIIKFAGDAIYAEWRIPQDLLLISKETALEYCVTAAALCGSIIVEKCSGFPISVKEENIDLTLNLHCGLSYGKIVSIHLGDDLLRREHLILGEVIEKASKAANSAGIGELVCCPKSMHVLLKTCRFDESFDKTKECKDSIIISRLSRCFFTPSPRHIQQIESTIGNYEPLTHVVLRLLNDMDIDELIRVNKLLSLYAHPVVAKNYAAETHFEGKLMLMGESKIEEAELRDVFVMFITPLIKVSLTGTDENNDLELFTKLNAIMNLVTKEVSRLEGQIRQFIMDDKGLVLIATFGLRGSTFHNLVAERALPTALKIHDCLSSELDVQSKIGATMGNAYCGLIGSSLRHEYAVLGPSVNLAARLMACAKNPGVLVNSQIRMMADRSYGFNALTPIYAKGYSDLVAIFEPLTPLRRRWGHMKPNFVGRTTEVQDLVEIAWNMAENPAETQTKLVLVSGVAGIGKSAFTLHVIDQIKAKLCPTTKKLFISKYAIRDSDAFTPFGAFALIILDAISATAEASDDISFSHFDCSNKSIGSSCAGSTSTKSNGRLAERVVNLCHELGATRETAHFIGQHLLRMNIQSYQREYSSSAKTSLVQLLSKAFISCTHDADFILIALDDVHLADEMSFKLIEELYTTTSNILFICSSRPHPTYDLKIDAYFWNVLNSEYFHQKRFIPLQLNPISSCEMKKLISHALGVHVEEVNDRVHRTVFAQSKGIPQFAHILLEQVAKTRVPSDGDSLKDLEKLAALSEVRTLKLICIYT